jgi:hypothetical protein
MKNQTIIQASESALAADEFATWIKKNRATVKKLAHYEVRPCEQVRGFILRLPGIGWKLWFSTVAEAVDFAGRVALIYAAECLVYDSSGHQIA